MRPLSLVCLALSLSLASAPTTLAQRLPSDVEEKFGLRPNQRVPSHVRRQLLREYRYYQLRKAEDDPVRRRQALCERHASRAGLSDNQVSQFMRWCMPRG
jgi:hypothetical protein